MKDHLVVVFEMMAFFDRWFHSKKNLSITFSDH